MDTPDEQTAAPARSVTLLGPAEIRELAEALDVVPTKKLGQNFVHDPNTVRKIVALSGVGPDDHVLEVGPGLGSLTLALLDEVDRVTAVEIDPRLAAHLPLTVQRFAPTRLAALDVIQQDALRVTRGDLAAAREGAGAAPSAGAGAATPVHPPTALVANLPYNVSVPVLLHLLQEFPTIERVLVMVQLEVADRLAAEPGSRVYGVPSVKAGFYGPVTRAATVGKNVFWPAPKIDSGLVRITRWASEDVPWRDVIADLRGQGMEETANDTGRDSGNNSGTDGGTDSGNNTGNYPPEGIREHTGKHTEEDLRRAVFSLADAAFLQRRKTLRAALAGWCGGAAAAEELLVAAGIDPKERGEKLSTADFVQLAACALRSGHAPGGQGSTGRSRAGEGHA